MSVSDQKNTLHPNIKQYVSLQDIERDSSINHIDLTESMLQQAGFVVYYGEILAQAKRQTDMAKQRLDYVEAQTIKDMRNIYIAKGDKAASETRLEKEVRLSPDYLDAQRQLADAKYVHTRLESVMKALEDRRSMLLQIGKQEMSKRLGNPHVSDND